MRKTLGDGWEVDEFAKDRDGKIFSRYWCRGKLAIRHELGGPRAKRFAGYSLIRKDLMNIAAWLRHSQERTKDTVATAGENRRQGDKGMNEVLNGLLVAIITTYGKLFVGAEGRKVKLEKVAITDARQIQLHDRLMDWRHAYAAHSGVNSPERSVVHAAIAEPQENTVGWKLGCDTSQPSSLMKSDYDLLSLLVEVLLKHTERKRTELSQQIREHELNDTEIRTILELYRKGGRKFIAG